MLICYRQLSNNEPKNTYHDKLIHNLDNRRLGLRRETPRDPQTPVKANGQ